MNETDNKDTFNVRELWPALPLAEWQDTCATLHMWTQIVGKIRMKLSAPVNHWWHCALYVTARGLTTSIIPYNGVYFELEFDFIDHMLAIRTSDGLTRTIALAPRSVADFYREVMATLKSIGIEVQIWTRPQEVPNPIPFEKDFEHAAYDEECAHRFWRLLAQADDVFKEFRGRFLGKVSPVNFYWGSFDLAVTRFSGRRAPQRPGADAITREAYSHEVISHGFWPGGGAVKGPAFYSYTAPAPTGLAEEKIRPTAAFYSQEMGEFLMMVEDVRSAKEPRQALLDFLQSTYEAGAKLAQWDRAVLDYPGK
jgi:hypothetical protein